MSSSSGASAPTLRSAQQQSLLTLLHFNQPREGGAPRLGGTAGSILGGATTNGSEGGVGAAYDANSASKEQKEITIPEAPPVWKVLILDKLAQEVLATSLRVQDLREAGVTLHM